MAHAKASSGEAKCRTTIRTGHHDLIADEGAFLGGADAGAAPYDLLCAALGACTAITLKMYAERKEWPLVAAHVDVTDRRDGDHQSIARVLTFEGGLDDAQRERLADIAERTPCDAHT